MQFDKGKAAAAGLLCAIAATMAVWSGPLFAASSALHAASQLSVHPVSHSDSHNGTTR